MGKQRIIVKRDGGGPEEGVLVRAPGGVMGTLGLESSWVAWPRFACFAFSYPAGCKMLIWECIIHLLSLQNREVGVG